ncbi:hypothetical protein DFH06DRAFT_970946, partial [Mycena polygramma]
MAELFDEPLPNSVVRHHRTFDPLTDYDPLVRFGVKDGLLEGRSAEETMMMRDILIRWTFAHSDLLWRKLEEGISSVVQLDAATKYMRTIERADGEVQQYYCVSPEVLLLFGHVSLATQQVLDGLCSFLNKADHHRFTLDPEFRWLRMLERHSSRSEICFAYSALQQRLRNAKSHIKNYLNSIQEVFTNTMSDERISSVNSTVTSVRSEFLRGDTLSELYKLLARSDYAAGV